MYYNVIVSEKDMDNPYCNQLVFYFGDDKEQAIEFAELIADISDYYVSLRPIKDEQNE